MAFYARSAGESLTVQIYPYAPAEKILKQFTPLTDYLQQKLNREIIIRISKDHNDHMETVGKDRTDIAYLGPVSYVQIVEKYGKKPVLARLEIRGSPMLQGVIFTSSTSRVRSLKDLTGKRFAFGYPNSTMSHLVPLSMMHEAGVQLTDLAHYKFLNDQYNVALGVLMGDFDVGAVNSSVFLKYKKRGLKVLAWTPEISEHLFVSRKTLPDEITASVRTALFELRQNRNVLAEMASLRKGLTGFVPVEDRDYDNLRSLLQKLDKIKP